MIFASESRRACHRNINHIKAMAKTIQLKRPNVVSTFTWLKYEMKMKTSEERLSSVLYEVTLKGSDNDEINICEIC